MAITGKDNAGLGNGCWCLCLSWIQGKDAAGAKGTVCEVGTCVTGNVNPAGEA